VVSDGKGGIRKLNTNLFYRTVATSLGIFRIKKNDAAVRIKSGHSAALKNPVSENRNQ